MELNIIVYLISNILGVYANYKLIKLNYNKKITSRKIEILSYILFYIMNCFVYVKYSTPVITLCTNIVGLFILTLNYSRSIKQNILVVIFVYFIGFLSDIIVTIIFVSSKFYILKGNVYMEFYIYIFVVITKYIITILLSEYKINADEGKKISFLQWISIVSIPIMTIILIAIFISINNNTSKTHIIISILIIVFINITSYQLYQNTIKLLKEENRKLILQQQNQYYINQLNMIQNDNKNMSKFRHDIKNHLISLKTLCDNNEIDDFKNYCENLLGTVDNSAYSKSGNSIIDSLVNYKLQNLSENTKKNISISVPSKLDIKDTDLTTLLGNLLDNALKAISETVEGKLLDLSINYNKGRLIIKIKNSYNNIIQTKDGDFLTTNNDRKKHGIGMSSIKEIIEKYNGTIKINTKDNIFDIVIIMYC